MNNLRDMIDLQNALHWQHFQWNNQMIPTSNWESMQSSELRKYWGWNEVPVSKSITNDPQQWDAIIIKLPADTCQQNDWGVNDDPSCLSDFAQQQLEQDLDDFVKNGKLLTGVDNVAQRPGSYVLFVREWGLPYGSDAGGDFGVNWSREFFCANWVSPNNKYQVVYGNPGKDSFCFVDTLTGPSPPPPTPTPPGSIHGIQNKLADPPVCLQAETKQAAMGQSVTVAECNGSEEQDWKYDSATNTITYKDMCLDATDMTSGNPLIIWECNGLVQQHWDDLSDGQSWATLSVQGNQCLDMWTSEATLERGLWTWDCNSADNQKWQLPQALWATV